jgi:molybdenum transport protein
MNPPITDDELLHLLRHEYALADSSASSVGLAALATRARFTAQNAMVVCGTEAAARLLGLAGAKARALRTSGASVEACNPLLEATGSGGAIHRAHKVAQALIAVLSGVATAARALVAAARSQSPSCAVACRCDRVAIGDSFARLAVEAGGATWHQSGRTNGVLVFAEPRALLDPAVPLTTRFACLRAAAPERRLLAEATSVEEAMLQAEAGADMIQVERLPPDAVARIAARLTDLRPRPLLAASGAFTPADAALYAAAGADLLVTATPYGHGKELDAHPSSQMVRGDSV